MTPPVAALRNAIVDRESPILAHVHWLFLITAHVNVVPEKSVSMLESKATKHISEMHEIS